MMDRLPFLHSELARSVRHVLDVNKAERHLRGGQATCMKYKRKKPELKAGFSATSEK